MVAAQASDDDQGQLLRTQRRNWLEALFVRHIEGKIELPPYVHTRSSIPLHELGQSDR
jgi:hypothetical protein